MKGMGVGWGKRSILLDGAVASLSSMLEVVVSSVQVV
jgi:hypothetical protein